MNTGKVVVGVLAGAAIGALMGVLFAPDKGSETRKKISQKGSDAVDELKEKLEAMLAAITDKYETVKDDLSHLAKEEMKKAESIKNTVKSNMS